MDLKYPRGVRDLMPNEAIFREELILKIKEIFQNFGFYPIDTPIFESLDVLFAKNAIGNESKLIYKIEGNELGLRYDHTVSLARFFAMHQEVQLPFKRYMIDKIWRKEEPQKMRYREIMQADIDIIGGNELYADAEVLAAISSALEKLNIKYELHLNNRQILDIFLETIGITMQDSNHTLLNNIMRIIDKLDKLDADKVTDLLNELNLGEEKVNQIMNFINFSGTNKAKLTYLQDILKENGTQLIKKIKDLLDLFKEYKLNCDPILDFSIVRGLDYYTSTIFEFKLSEGASKSSIAAGGRYDKLISVYTNKNVPAVGASIGINRIMDYLNYSNSKKFTYSDVYIAYIKPENYEYAVNTATLLRNAGISADLNISDKNLSNQLHHASMLNFKLAVIIGHNEQAANQVTVRNFETGAEEKVKLEELINFINKKIID